MSHNRKYSYVFFLFPFLLHIVTPKVNILKLKL